MIVYSFFYSVLRVISAMHLDRDCCYLNAVQIFDENQQKYEYYYNQLSQSAGTVEYFPWIPSTNECPADDFKLHLLVRLKCWKFRESGVSFHCNYSAVVVHDRITSTGQI